MQETLFSAFVCKTGTPQRRRISRSIKIRTIYYVVSQKNLDTMNIAANEYSWNAQTIASQIQNGT
jgi:hypothetical protein